MQQRIRHTQTRLARPAYVYVRGVAQGGEPNFASGCSLGWSDWLRYCSHAIAVVLPFVHSSLAKMFGSLNAFVAHRMPEKKVWSLCVSGQRVVGLVHNVSFQLCMSLQCAGARTPAALAL